MKINEKLTNVDYSDNHICSDANNATETGGYYTNSTTINIPITGGGGYLDVKKCSDTRINQTWTNYIDNQIFNRQYNNVNDGWGEWKKLLLDGTILYENINGTVSNFTLNDSAANYKYIEIYTRQDEYTNGYKCQKVYDPNGKKVVINYSRYESTNPARLQTFGISVTFNGKSATIGDKFGYVTGGQAYATTGDSVKIVKVLGYK